MQVPSN